MHTRKRRDKPLGVAFKGFLTVFQLRPFSTAPYCLPLKSVSLYHICEAKWEQEKTEEVPL